MTGNKEWRALGRPRKPEPKAIFRLTLEDAWVTRSVAPMPDLDLESDASFADKRNRRLEQYKQYNDKRRSKRKASSGAC